MNYNNPTMARFKYADNSQGQFIAVNLKEQIAFGTFEWAVSHVIDKTGMPLFEKNYHNRLVQQPGWLSIFLMHGKK
jgi:hypothetical protein